MYRSAFGGLWTDRIDAGKLLAAKLRAGAVTEAEAELLRGWIDDGYAVLRHAVPHEVLDAFDREIEESWARGRTGVQIEINDEIPAAPAAAGAPRRFLTDYSALDPALRGRKLKILDLYVHSENARKAAFAPAILRFLRIVFEREPLLFQSLSFERGTEQPLHQDTAYVVVSSPLEMAAAWIALEDVGPGTGELAYYPGSHRMREFTFENGLRWDMVADGWEAHQRYLDGIHAEASRLGLAVAHFRPRKGDALLWTAALAHGGGPVERPRSSRKSFVCHYCPEGVEPAWFARGESRRTIRRREDGGAYCSLHYAV